MTAWALPATFKGRHMAQTTAHLADHVIPPTPAQGSSTDSGEFVQVHDDRDIKQVSTRLTFTITIPAGRPGPKPRRRAG